MKAVLRGKFVALSAHIKRIENNQINNLMTHFQAFEKQEQTNHKAKRRQEIVKMRAEINEVGD